MSNPNTRILIACLLGICLLPSGTAFTQEKKMTLKSLPPNVQNTVREQTKGATVLGISREVEDGKARYEVETMVNGRTRDFMVAAAGKLLDVEDQMDLASVPPAVKAAIQKEAGQGKILRIESVKRDGTLQCYASILQKRARKWEIQIGTDGKLIPAKK
jgi:uncharacterized membrane protein YkoI